MTTSYTIRENDVLAMMNSALFSQNSNADTNTSSITRKQFWLWKTFCRI